MSSQTPTDVSYSTDTEQRTNSSDLFDALANERRQFVIRAVADEVHTHGELATTLAKSEAAASDDTRFNAKQRKAVYVTLYQNHLEKLEALDIISWDRQSGQVTAGPAHERALRTVRFASAEDGDELVTDGGQPTCTNCGERILQTTVTGPSTATNACGCEVHPELATDGGQPDEQLIAGVDYTCRVCGGQRTVYVSPTLVDDTPVIDLDSRNRLCSVSCTGCDAERTHVATATLSRAGPQDRLVTDGGVPESFADLARTCESCGDDVEPDRLIEGECPGCHYRPDAVADGGGTAWTDLTGFKRDLLEAIRRLDQDGQTVYGLAIKEEVGRVYGEEINHVRLYPNLDDLVAAGLVEKSELDKRTNEYELTTEAESMLEHRARLLADACGMEQPVADGGDR